MPILELTFASGEDSLSVRTFSTMEAVSTLFHVTVTACSPKVDLNLESLVGKAATLRVVSGFKFALLGGSRLWTGVCNHIEQSQPEPLGLSTYRFSSSPCSGSSASERIVGSTSTTPSRTSSTSSSASGRSTRLEDRPRALSEARVQGPVRRERLCLPDAASSRRRGSRSPSPTTTSRARGSRLGDELHASGRAAGPPIPYVDNPNHGRRAGIRHPGAPRPRGAARRVHASATTTSASPLSPSSARRPRRPRPRHRYEQYHYHARRLARRDRHRAADTPVADDKGVARHEPKRSGHERRSARSRPTRVDKRSVALRHELDRPRARRRLLDRAATLTPSSPSGRGSSSPSSRIEGTPGGEWRMAGQRGVRRRALPPAAARRPSPSPRRAERDGRRPGGAGDPHRRVRPGARPVPLGSRGKDRRRQLVLDPREPGLGGHRLRHDQPPARRSGGAGRLPRRAIRISRSSSGRVFNANQPVPYKLPEHKTRSTWKSDSSPGGERLQRDHVRGPEGQRARLHAGAEEPAQAGQERRDDHRLPRPLTSTSSSTRPTRPSATGSR